METVLGLNLFLSVLIVAEMFFATPITHFFRKSATNHSYYQLLSFFFLIYLFLNKKNDVQ